MKLLLSGKKKGYEVDILTQNPTYPLGKIFDIKAISHFFTQKPPLIQLSSRKGPFTPSPGKDVEVAGPAARKNIGTSVPLW